MSRWASLGVMVPAAVILAGLCLGCGEEVTRVSTTGEGAVTNAPPSAAAGPDRVIGAGAAAELDGTGSSDPDGDVLHFLWAQTSGSPIALRGVNSATAGFTAPGVPGDILIFVLTVTDEGDPVLFDTDEVVITIGTSPGGNNPPQADAGPDQDTQANTLVALDGSGSFDPDGDSLSYAWTQTAGPAVNLTGADTAAPTFTTTAATGVAYTFRLDVTDNGDPPLSDSDSVTVRVGSPPAVTYTNTTKAIFDARCVLCHPASLPPDLSNYPGVYGARNQIVAKVSPGGSMRGYLTDEQAQTIIDWINQGAPE